MWPCVPLKRNTSRDTPRSPIIAGDMSDQRRFLPPIQKKKKKGRGPSSRLEKKMEIPTQPPILYGLRESFVNHTDFSSSLAKHVFSDKHTNFVLSPLSIHVALSLLAAGSNGPTRDQLLSFIRFDSVEEVNSLYSQVVDLVIVDDEPLGGPRLSLANGVWLDRNLTLKPAFRDIVHNVYKAACSPVDFLKKVINKLFLNFQILIIMSLTIGFCICFEDGGGTRRSE